MRPIRSHCGARSSPLYLLSRAAKLHKHAYTNPLELGNLGLSLQCASQRSSVDLFAAPHGEICAAAFGIHSLGLFSRCLYPGFYVLWCTFKGASSLVGIAPFVFYHVRIVLDVYLREDAFISPA